MTKFRSSPLAAKSWIRSTQSMLSTHGIYPRLVCPCLSILRISRKADSNLCNNKSLSKPTSSRQSLIMLATSEMVSGVLYLPHCGKRCTCAMENSGKNQTRSWARLRASIGKHSLPSTSRSESWRADYAVRWRPITRNQFFSMRF